MRIRIALSLGAFLLAGGAVMGTAIATAAPAQVQPPTSATQAPAPTRTTSRATEPTRTTAQAPEVRAPGAVPQRVPRAIPAGPTGDVSLPAITEGN